MGKGCCEGYDGGGGADGPWEEEEVNADEAEGDEGATAAGCRWRCIRSQLVRRSCDKDMGSVVETKGKDFLGSEFDEDSPIVFGLVGGLNRAMARDILNRWANRPQLGVFMHTKCRTRK